MSAVSAGPRGITHALSRLQRRRAWPSTGILEGCARVGYASSCARCGEMRTAESLAGAAPSTLQVLFFCALTLSHRESRHKTDPGKLTAEADKKCQTKPLNT